MRPTSSRGIWRYLFRAIDQFGQVIDVFLSPRRDANAARCFFERAIDRTRISPVEVTTDRYRAYPRIIDDLLPAAFHDTVAHANNPLETDHGRLKAGFGPSRGLTRDLPPGSSSPAMPSSRVSAEASTISESTYRRPLDLPKPSTNWPS
jgi:DDE domain